MANYYGYARSNYFKVKDLEKFKAEFIDELDLELITHKEMPGFYGFLANGEGGIPHTMCNADDQIVDVDFDAKLAEHLTEDTVAIYQEVGHEKLRYLAGFATAVNHKGETRHISLYDIYEKAREICEKPIEITLAEY